MSYYTTYIEDSADAKLNRQTTLGCNGSGPAYNAVISVSFSDEAPLEPVSLDEVKDWLRIDDIDDEDNLVTALITAARMVCENYSNISFIERTVTAKIHNGLGNFNLPYGPVIGNVTSFTDSEDVAITDYKLVDPHNGDITVVYNAGYEELPENLKTALRAQITWLYRQRGDEPVASALSLPTKLILQQVRNV